MNDSIYSATSPYFNTGIVNSDFLDVMVNRPIPMLSTDRYWTITMTYQHRPDLLAYDLYSDASLWWVFASRNPNTLVDPMFDFVSGTSIYIPTGETLKQALGL